MITASYLFAPNKYNIGEHRCFYCGMPCDGTYTKKKYVKQTFTNRDIVKYPGSDYVCGCCVESLSGIYEVTQIDGTTKIGRAGQPRMYSWVLTENKKLAMTKKHLRVLRRICLSPPKPPFSIVLADSGQKQLIFRAPVNYDQNIFSVLLEEKEISVEIATLKKYLQKAKLVAAAIGKIALKNPDEFINYKNIIDLYGSEGPLVEWIKIYSSPLGELAAWLCPGKEEAKNDFVISTRISSKAGGIGRYVEKSTGNGREGNQGGSDQVLFEFT
ncbi:hypothetical protein [Sediminispirochaeta smaragdinae]|uniref:Uncharacterized protein n=1 Tax=Sediminispirochaeta smaragdinae (strain DSM 11293 / JCM 15392 / SEBR 4228) TaxID=573413 RepID=E1R3I9_SEDSS|nr:hypothetical protein [Sediminispirochaeta smaragdinae]ADK81620.1 hypothetical protein Spirs_2507 [Sediminispirochaeta smaragdinae DSM 11293]